MNHFKRERFNGSLKSELCTLIAGATMLFALVLSGVATTNAAPITRPPSSPPPPPSPADVAVLSVLEPVPPGAQPGGGMFLQATVKLRPFRTRPTTVSFYLSKDRVLGASDIQLAGDTIGPFDHPDTLGVAGHVPAGVAPGFYFVLGCAGTKCVPSAATIHVLGQGLSIVSQSPGLKSLTAGQPEYFPERPADGMSVGTPFACPFSFHGQWPGSCVFVTTRVFPGNLDTDGFNYCPIDHPYPFEVAIGFDPLWNDVGTNPAQTNVVSFTKYRQDSDDVHWQSYGGLDPSDPNQRGYVWFFWDQVGAIDGQAQFLCTDQPATSAAP